MTASAIRALVHDAITLVVFLGGHAAILGHWCSWAEAISLPYPDLAGIACLPALLLAVSRLI
jgi:hypothetical protein